ncbi:MAG: quinoprotein dehydrogenase-associated putative ABC transporter substrate-binding protein [Betaproteobacteria bacterium]
MNQADFSRKGIARTVTVLLALALPFVATVRVADAAETAERTAFRVCSDPGNLPFSNEAGEGFENKLAELMAQELGLPLKYYFYPQRMNFVRNTLRFKLPDEDYRCDVMLGVPVGFDQVATTGPYFRSTYALVYVKGRKLDGVKSAGDLLAMGDKAKSLRIGVFDRSPATAWLARHNLVDAGAPYRMLNARPDFYPGEILEKDLVAGDIDAAIVWGPVAGFAARRVTSVELVVIPLRSEPGVKFDFAVAMGTRFGETQWKQKLETLIASNQAQILQILHEYRVPLVDENGNPVP